MRNANQILDQHQSFIFHDFILWFLCFFDIFTSPKMDCSDLPFFNQDFPPTAEVPRQELHLSRILGPSSAVACELLVSSRPRHKTKLCTQHILDVHQMHYVKLNLINHSLGDGDLLIQLRQLRLRGSRRKSPTVPARYGGPGLGRWLVVSTPLKNSQLGLG